MNGTTAASVALVLSLLLGTPAAALAGTGAANDAARSSTALQDAPEPEWNETYGGPGSDRLAGITKTDGGGYVLTGWGAGEGQADGWVLEIDGSGAVQWEKRLGGGAFDKLYAALPTDDGYLLVGSNGTSSGAQGWLVKVDDAGEVQWERTYGAGGFWAGERTDDGYLLAGWTRGEDAVDGWAVMVDVDGEVQWERTYAGPEGTTKEYVKSVVVTNESYLLAGVSEAGDDRSGWAVRTDRNGTAAWERTYGDAQINDLWDAAPADDGYVLAGETGTAEVDGRDAWALRVDADGAVVWDRTYGGEEYDWVDAVIPTADGFLFTGGTETGDFGAADGYLLATDGDGEPVHERSFGSAGWEKSWPVVEAHGGGYLLAGETGGFGADGKDGWVTKMSGFGSDAATTTESGETDESDGPEDAMPNDTPETDVESAEETNNAEGQPGFTAFSALAALLALVMGASLVGRE